MHHAFVMVCSQRSVALCNHHCQNQMSKVCMPLHPCAVTYYHVITHACLLCCTVVLYLWQFMSSGSAWIYTSAADYKCVIIEPDVQHPDAMAAQHMTCF